MATKKKQELEITLVVIYNKGYLRKGQYEIFHYSVEDKFDEHVDVNTKKAYIKVPTSFFNMNKEDQEKLIIKKIKVAEPCEWVTVDDMLKRLQDLKNEYGEEYGRVPLKALLELNGEVISLPISFIDECWYSVDLGISQNTPYKELDVK